MRAALCRDREVGQRSGRVLQTRPDKPPTGGDPWRQRGPQVLVAEVCVAALDGPPGQSVGGVLSANQRAEQEG